MSESDGIVLSETSELQAFPFPICDPLGLPVEYAERRASCPFGKVRLSSGHEAVLLTTYRDTAAAISNPGLSHDLTAPGSARMWPGPNFLDNPDNVANMEGEHHRRIRRILAPAFTPRAIARRQPVVEQVAVELIDKMIGGPRPADIVESYCFPLPVRIICRLLGVPEGDAGRFREWSQAFISGAEMRADRQVALLDEFHGYMVELVSHKRRHPGQDLIDDLIAARDGEDQLSESELLTLSVSLITAGNETTSDSLSRYLVTLLADNELLWRQLVADPDLVPAAVDELLRVTPLNQGASLRVATEDVELPSGTVAAGDAVLLPLPVAMRDESVFSDPDRVLFDREQAPTLVFGGGSHTCLGIHLVLSELRTSLRLLTSRLPTLRLACDIGSLRFTNGHLSNSLRELSVDW